MNLFLRVATVVLAAAVTVSAGPGDVSPEADIKGASDHPLVRRYPGSIISHYYRLEDGEYTLPLGALKNGLPEKTMPLAGRVFRITYESPEKWSTLSTFDALGGILRKAGFEILFISGGQSLAQCDEWPEYFYRDYYLLQGITRDQRFLSAKLARPQGDVYAALYVSLGWYTHAVAQLDIIEVKKQPL